MTNDEDIANGLANTTKYATLLKERETGNKYWKSGQFVGVMRIAESKRPFLDREAIYDVARTVELDEPTAIANAVGEAMKKVNGDSE